MIESAATKFFIVELANAVEQPRTLIGARDATEAHALIEHWISRSLTEHEEHLANIRKLKRLLRSRLSNKDFKVAIADLLHEMGQAKTASLHWVKAAEIWCHMTGHVIVLHEINFPH
jgi:hypothetical protein